MESSPDSPIIHSFNFAQEWFFQAVNTRKPHVEWGTYPLFKLIFENPDQGQRDEWSAYHANFPLYMCLFWPKSEIEI